MSKLLRLHTTVVVQYLYVLTWRLCLQMFTNIKHALAFADIRYLYIYNRQKIIVIHHYVRLRNLQTLQIRSPYSTMNIKFILLLTAINLFFQIIAMEGATDRREEMVCITSSATNCFAWIDLTQLVSPSRVNAWYCVTCNLKWIIAALSERISSILSDDAILI